MFDKMYGIIRDTDFEVLLSDRFCPYWNNLDFNEICDNNVILSLRSQQKGIIGAVHFKVHYFDCDDTTQSYIKLELLCLDLDKDLWGHQFDLYMIYYLLWVCLGNRVKELYGTVTSDIEKRYWEINGATVKPIEGEDGQYSVSLTPMQFLKPIIELVKSCKGETDIVKLLYEYQDGRYIRWLNITAKKCKGVLDDLTCVYLWSEFFGKRGNAYYNDVEDLLLTNSDVACDWVIIKIATKRQKEIALIETGAYQV